MDIESRLINKRIFHVHITIMEDEYEKAISNEFGLFNFSSDLTTIVLNEIQRQLKIIDKKENKEL